MKLVINKCYGGFSLSERAIELYFKKKGMNLVIETDSRFGLKHYYINEVSDDNYFYDRDLERDDPILVEVVEELDEDADGDYAQLKIVEIPDDVKWIVEEYDGMEWIAEVHRTWS